MNDATTTAPSTNARARARALFAVLLAQFMVVLDATVVNVALPFMAKDLHLGDARLTWITNAYLIAFGGLLLLFGRLGDLFGRRRIFLVGLGVFTAASAACGLAGGAGSLILARFLQGIGAAAASSVVLAIIATEFPAPEDRARAMSGYVFVSVSGGSLGLLIGGALTQALSWHWIFLINIPVGLLAIFLARAHLRESPRLARERGVDVAGSALVTAAAMTGIYALVEAAHHPIASAAVAGPGLAAVALAVAFFALQGRLANPIFPLRMLRIRSLMVSSLVRAFMVMGMYAAFFFGVLELSRGHGFSPMQIGLAFLPMTLTVAILSRGLSARLMRRYGPRALLAAGLLAIAAAMWAFAHLPDAAGYWPWRFFTYATLGLGAGSAFLPLLTIAMSDVPARDAGLGSAIVNLSMQLAAAVDLAVLATVASHRTESLLAAHASLRLAAIGGYQRAYSVALLGVAVAFAIAALMLRPRAAEPAAALERAA